MHIKPLRNDIAEFIEKHQLAGKWQKIRKLFESNTGHPSLNVELLEPKWHGIYSLRIDRKYRALFFVSGGTAEVFQVTKHYKKS